MVFKNNRDINNPRYIELYLASFSETSAVVVHIAEFKSTTAMNLDTKGG